MWNIKLGKRRKSLGGNQKSLKIDLSRNYWMVEEVRYIYTLRCSHAVFVVPKDDGGGGRVVVDCR